MKIAVKFLKITKNKIKLLAIFFIFYFLLNFLLNFIIGVFARNFGIEFYDKTRAFLYLPKLLILLIVSYAMLTFIKKSFLSKKYLKELAIIFLSLFTAERLSAAIPVAFSKVFSSEIYFSNTAQAASFILQLVIFYIAICFIDSKKLGMQKDYS